MANTKYPIHTMCISCGKKQALVKSMCKVCYEREWKKSHPQRDHAWRISRRNSGNVRTHPGGKRVYDGDKDTCDLLHHHHEATKDDPEHLTTEFLQELIGIKCKDKTQQKSI